MMDLFQERRMPLFNPEPPDIPDDLEALKKRCEALGLDNVIFRETKVS